MSPEGGGNRAGTRILIVKLSAVGDVVHALPVLHALRTAMPDAHIAWAVHPGPANLLEGHPELDELVVLPRRPWGPKSPPPREILRRLRAGGPWDAAIDLQGLAKSGIVTLASGARRRVGFAGPASREGNALFMNARVRPATTPVITMNLELLAPLGIDTAAATAAPVAVLHTTADDERHVAAWADAHNPAGERLLVIDPFAGWETKLWPKERWVQLAARARDALGLRPVIFFGPGERDHAESLAREMGAAGADALTAPPTTLRQYSALLKHHAAAMVGADTGPMHMAAAAGVPTVAIFGPSCSRRNAPVFAGARFEVLQDWSQPCAGTFTRKCPHHAPGMCQQGVSVDEVFAALARVTAGAPRPA